MCISKQLKEPNSFLGGFEYQFLLYIVVYLVVYNNYFTCSSYFPHSFFVINVQLNILSVFNCIQIIIFQSIKHFFIILIKCSMQRKHFLISRPKKVLGSIARTQ